MKLLTGKTAFYIKNAKNTLIELSINSLTATTDLKMMKGISNEIDSTDK
jgi:hypothetical protein